MDVAVKLDARGVVDCIRRGLSRAYNAQRPRLARAARTVSIGRSRRLIVTNCPPAKHDQLHVPADFRQLHQADEVPVILDRRAVESQDDVVDLQPGVSGGRRRRHLLSLACR